MQSVKVDTATSGDNAIVAADAGGRAVVVRGFFLVAAGTVTIQFGSDLAGNFTALTGAMSAITGTPLQALPPNGFDVPALMQTTPGKALNLKLGGNVQVSGFLLVDFV